VVQPNNLAKLPAKKRNIRTDMKNSAQQGVVHLQ